MEVEKEKNNALLNIREQQNGATTSSPSPSPATVPDSMPTLNIGYYASAIFILFWACKTQTLCIIFLTETLCIILAMNILYIRFLFHNDVWLTMSVTLDLLKD
jgi:hypothetical protein